jgi:hypothetical protein
MYKRKYMIFVEIRYGEVTYMGTIKRFINNDQYKNKTIKNQSSNEKSKVKGIQTIKSKLEVGLDCYVAFDSEKNINGKDYYVYTINKYSDDSNGYHAYCIDIHSGDLFSWYGDQLLPIE